jgi:hypothetical protein
LTIGYMRLISDIKKGLGREQFMDSVQYRDTADA